MASKDDDLHKQVDISAAPRREFEHLTADQKAVVWRILLRTYELADEEAEKMRVAGGSAAYQQSLFTRRPQNVFLIDGARGSGKTTMLFTVRWLMEHLGAGMLYGQPPNWGAPDVPPAEVSAMVRDQETAARFYNDLIGRFLGSRSTQDPQCADTNEKTAEHPGLGDGRPFYRAHQIYSGNRHRTVCVLPPIFPSDLEENQPIMEGILSLMAKRLDEELEKETESTKRSKKLKRLRDKAYQQVITGWYLSRNEGQEALLRDSLSLENYMEKRGKRSGESFQRVFSWRSFVLDFLDVLECQVLSVFLDDTDVRPETTADMMNAIRIFLDHPRIVTVLAGNMRTMRQSILLTRMAQLREPIETLSRPDDTDAVEWRRNLRQEVEEYFDKVLPRYNRFFLSVRASPLSSDAHETGASDEPEQRDDFETILDVSFDQLCWEQLKRFEASYVQTRLRSAMGLEPVRLDKHNVGGPILHPSTRAATRVDLENYMAWWLFWTTYGYELRPRSIRQLIVMSQSTRPSPGSKRLTESLPSEHSKRLSVVLFESPENAALIHRFGDADHSVIDWIRRQNVESIWRGERYFGVNSRRLFSGGYSYDYLSFRIDLEIADPLQGRAKFDPPRQLLPEVAGPDLTGRFPFFCRPAESQRRYGAAGAMRHSAIPANCLYFSDLDYLPEIVWDNADGEHSDRWGSKLAYEWHRLFRLSRSHIDGKESEDAASLPAQAARLKGVPEDILEIIGDLLGEDPKKPADLWKKFRKLVRKNRAVDDYWLDVVLPLGSLDLNQFMRFQTAADNRDKRLIRDEIAPSPEPFFQSQVETIESLRRQLDYISRLAPRLDNKQALQETTLKAISEQIVERLLGEERSDQSLDEHNFAALRSRLNDYAWLICHARRAWHAGRIAFGQIVSASMFGGRERRARSFRLGRQDIYELPTRREIYQFLGALALPAGQDLGEFADVSRDLHDWGKGQLDGFAKLSIEEENLVKGGRKNKKADAAHLIGWSEFADPTRSGDLGPINFVDAIGAMLDYRTDCRDIDRWASKMEPPRHRDTPASKELKIFLQREPARSAVDKSGTEDGRSQCRHDQTRTQHALFERAIVFFLWGLGPSLPALIHLEVAGSAYAYMKEKKEQGEKSNTDKKSSPPQDGHEYSGSEIKDILKGWTTLLKFFHRYALRSRAGIEYDLVQLLFAATASSETFRGKEWSGPEAPLAMPRFGDAAVESLGVAGPAAFAAALDQALAKEKPEEKAGSKNDGNAKKHAFRKAFLEALTRRLSEWHSATGSGLRFEHSKNGLSVKEPPQNASGSDRTPNENGDATPGDENSTPLNNRVRQKWNEKAGIYGDIEEHLQAALQYVHSVASELKINHNDIGFKE